MKSVTCINAFNIKNIKTKGMQIFNVPNTNEGLMFLELASKFLNRPEYKIRNRGRGTRNDSLKLTCPVKDARWIATYIEGKAINDIRSSRYALNNTIKDACASRDEDIKELEEELSRAEKEKAELEKKIMDLKSLNETLMMV